MKPFLCGFLLWFAAFRGAGADDRLVYISSFASGGKGTINAFRLDDTGKLSLLQKTTGIDNPFYVAVSPNQKFLYAISARQFGGKEDEQVAAYQIVGGDGELKALNRQSARGSAACYLDVDATGKTVLVANSRSSAWTQNRGR